MDPGTVTNAKAMLVTSRFGDDAPRDESLLQIDVLEIRPH
jgi:hypothetical protein